MLVMAPVAIFLNVTRKACSPAGNIHFPFMKGQPARRVRHRYFMAASTKTFFFMTDIAIIGVALGLLPVYVRPAFLVRDR